MDIVIDADLPDEMAVPHAVIYKGVPMKIEPGCIDHAILSDGRSYVAATNDDYQSKFYELTPEGTLLQFFYMVMLNTKRRRK